MSSNGFRQNIRELKFDELGDFLVEKGIKKIHAKRIMTYLWKSAVNEFDLMHEIPSRIVSVLKEFFFISYINIHSKQTSEDGTSKLAFILSDDALVEGVLIPTNKRVTACVSSQVGCKFNCSFCATGKLGFTRHLKAHEIYDQVYSIKTIAEKELNKDLSNVVFMGMGEPLENYTQVSLAAEMMISNMGMNLSHRKITISTVGLVPMIKRMADDLSPLNLAISLHSAVDETRSAMMPINKKYNLACLRDAVMYYTEKTKQPATFEYLLLRGKNDSLSDAQALVDFCSGYFCKVNLIEYNANEDGEFMASDDDTRNAFFNHLAKNKIIVSIRRSRGKDIDAACGQLANKGNKN